MFQRFFSYLSCTDWLLHREQVVGGTFCCDAAFAPVAPLKVYHHLAKLAEVAHFINVREVTYVGSCLKGKSIGIYEPG
ncbi:hypothetical protein A8C56_20535 [Niabella ginsenosidivorans]|uniref:Uncharacterized protein n=1 Tax=Niabella ginsenosidivorans TaxID=1176587 RepID=A0A1A9I8Q8_9BACT|nr:hypothetical protein [Niabella ginsenosidivorans]ANH83052.1 hypothetical protein A8C56_20535 [Niabella ginsenosidivorans]